MLRLGIIWAAHFFATVAGWYLVGALEQGVADGTGVAPLALILLFGIIQILAFPIVVAASWLYPMDIGGFRLDSFLLFVVLAAVNSAAVVAGIVALIRAFRHQNSDIT